MSTFIVEDIEFTRERINQKKNKTNKQTKNFQLEIEWYGQTSFSSYILYKNYNALHIMNVHFYC